MVKRLRAGMKERIESHADAGTERILLVSRLSPSNWRSPLAFFPDQQGMAGRLFASLDLAMAGKRRRRQLRDPSSIT